MKTFCNYTQTTIFKGTLTPNFCIEKVQRVSSYAYCANNPVIYIDPDGRKIVVSIQESGQKNPTKLYYKNGNLYTNKTYTNQYTGNNEFALAVESDLKNIASKGGELECRLTTLVDSKNTHTIEMGKENRASAPAEAKDGARTGSTIYYNRDDKKVRESRSSLVHELLGHGYSVDQGHRKYGKERVDFGNGNSTYLEQIGAIDIQNIYNKKVGLPLRTTDLNKNTKEMFDVSKLLNLKLSGKE